VEALLGQLRAHGFLTSPEEQVKRVSAPGEQVSA
jgi:hypothetical protein